MSHAAARLDGGSALIDIVPGYHGTSRERAEQILSDGFHPSRNAYDWLGHGVYFFERAPARALEWSRKLVGPEQACVVAADVELRDCLDLTDLPGVAKLRPFFQLFVDIYGRDYVAGLRQTEMARRFDCEVINWACDQLEERYGPIRVIREAFPEGLPFWSDPEGRLASSGLLDLSHVQLLVRDLSILSNHRMHEPTGNDS